MIQFHPDAFTTGPFVTFADVKHRARWILQCGVESTPHMQHGTWFTSPAAPEPPNSLSIYVAYGGPSWFDSPDEFNRLPYNEIRAQIANAVESTILQVLDSGGSPATVADIRNGTVA